MTETSTAKKLTGGIVTVIILSFCLLLTTFAIVYSSVSVENNLFRTGNVKINLNDGNPVIHEDEFIFEPGMTVKKEFFIQNESTESVYYKLYFDNVSGGLSNVLKITLKDGDKTLYIGTVDELNKRSVVAADDVLRAGEKRNLSVCFYFPENAGNGMRLENLEFSLCADATQTRNNPNKLFD